MGCHTWFYIHEADKQEELKEQFRTEIENNIRRVIDSMGAKSNTDLKSQFNDYRDVCQSFLNYCKNHSKSDTIYHYQLSGDDDYRNTVERSTYAVECGNAEWYRQYSIRRWKNMLDELHNTDIIEFMKKHPESSNELFEIVDDKIYIDSGITDIFRIHDYDAADCFSMQDVFDRCTEYDVVLNDKQIDSLKQFWEQHPDSMITFG